METTTIEMRPYKEAGGSVRPSSVKITLPAAPWDKPKSKTTDQPKTHRELVFDALGETPQTAAEIARVIGVGINSFAVAGFLQHLVNNGDCLKTDYTGGATSTYWVDKA